MENVKPLEVKATASGNIIVFRAMMPDDVEAAIKVMEKGFYPYEAVCMATGINDNPDAINDLNELNRHVAMDKLSVVAADAQTGQIVGVLFSKIQVKQFNEVSTFHLFKQKCKSKGAIALLDLMIQLDAKINVFDRYNVDKLVELVFLAVLPEHRRQAIGQSLVAANLELCRRKHFSLASALFTSDYTQVIAKKLQFDILSEISFEELTYKGSKYSDKVPPYCKSIAVSAKKIPS